jgi:hypothetical protein
MFEQKIRLEPGQNYCVAAMIEGPSSKYGCSGMDLV